jgi:hypothetical protein
MHDLIHVFVSNGAKFLGMRYEPPIRKFFEPKSERFRTYVRRALEESVGFDFSTDKISSRMFVARFLLLREY